MPFSIQTKMHIPAAPKSVWKVLTDFKSYPEWNSFVQSLEGEVKEGKQIKVQLPGMKFRPEIIHFIENQHFAWRGKLWFKGLFDGEHHFKLQALPDGTTEFHHYEHFKGILVPLFKKQLKSKVKAGFEKMNQDLKFRVERAGES